LQTAVFRRRRQRRQFRELIATEVARLGSVVEDAVVAVDEDIERTASELRELPGAAPMCSGCGARMRVERVKTRRHWWTLWVCPACGRTVRPAEVLAQRSFSEVRP
jgi:hypothetical protein